MRWSRPGQGIGRSGKVTISSASFHLILKFSLPAADKPSKPTGWGQGETPMHLYVKGDALPPQLEKPQVSPAILLDKGLNDRVLWNS